MPDAPLQVVVLAAALGPRWIAVRASDIREILGRVSVVPLPSGREGLIGVVPWRGRAVAVLDLAATVGDDTGGARARTLILELGTDTIAVPVDRVREARLAEATRAGHAAKTPFSTVEVELEGEVMPLFEPSLWLATLEGGSS